MNRFTAFMAGWSRRLIGVSALTAVAAAVSLAGAPGAFAADDYLNFSVDGTTYGPSLAAPIFNEAFQYVPGAASGATIWVRNSSGEPASLSLAAVVVRSVPELSNHLGLQAGQSSELSDRAALGPQGACTDLGPAWNLGAGETRKLSFVLDLSVDAPNAAMNQTADVDLLFLLESTDIAARGACAAAPAGTETGSADLQILPGTAAAPSNPTNNAGIAVSQDTTPAQRNPRNADPQELTVPEKSPDKSPDANPGIVAAGFQSTVEPIIRSLSGTLLIAMSVVFTVAVVLRLRNRRA